VSKSVKPTRNSRIRTGRLSLGSAVVAIVVLAAAAVTVVSRHRVISDQAQSHAKASQRVGTLSTSRKFSPANQSIKAQDLAPEEADRLASGLGEMIDPSANGLTEVRHSDGSVSIDLNGHFENVTVARVERNGGVSQSCVNNPEAAGAFFGINPSRITSPSSKTRLLRQ
jgi:hypothetical protein